MWIWMFRISLDMIELRYVRAKCGRLRCGGLDAVEGQLKTVHVCYKSISRGKAGLIFQNERAKNA
jgi:hypothetical protein